MASDTHALPLSLHSPFDSLFQGNLTDQSQVLLAHVHDNHHYVLLTGWDPESKLLTVNDPFYNSTVHTLTHKTGHA